MKEYKNKNLITMKFAYITDEQNLGYITSVLKSFNNVLRSTYNRVVKNPNYSTKDLTLSQSELNNVDGCKSHLKNSALYKSRELYAVNKESISAKVIFGEEKTLLTDVNIKLVKKNLLKNVRIRFIPLDKAIVMVIGCLEFIILIQLHLNQIETTLFN